MSKYTLRALCASIFALFIMMAEPGVSRAYPVLDAVAGLPYPELITVYPDEHDPNLYYFVPTSISFVYETLPDGKIRPRLGVQYWGLTGPDVDGAGGNFAFSVQPSIDNEKVNRVADDLKKIKPNARFAFPTLVSSRMDLILNGAFVAENQDKTAPTTTTAGTVDATQGFAIGLSRIGARAFAQGVAADSDVFAARYTYKFTGVAKRLHARITVKEKRVYDHFKTTGGASGWWGMVKTSWAADWQQLKTDGSITVDILQGGETDDEEYILEVFKTLVNAKINGEGMFKPELKPGGLPNAPEASNFGWGFSASSGWEHIDEEHKFTFEINKQKLEDREFSVGLSFNAVCAKYPDSFADLTLVGKKCIDKNAFAATTGEVQACQQSKLVWLKGLLDQGLITQAVYEARVAKVFEDPCYKDQTISTATISASEQAFEPLVKALANGEMTSDQAQAAVTPWLDRPDRLAADVGTASFFLQQSAQPNIAP
ncbi:hypothetical protein ELH33_32910 (plasmid) [Rhizobium ruizarguesonis]|uniref:hypothetical protein n=1 Tax=Rhizobium ruizarguesonis TaxID=2081791 RepID=UPI00103020E6|nr:hypothetical protein [Rhizobium ruizarguesonis]TBC25580.1 hypothetical protein ELH33_32910 [Rhizobium ruizarguesonis]